MCNRDIKQLTLQENKPLYNIGIKQRSNRYIMWGKGKPLFNSCVTCKAENQLRSK